LGSRLRITVLAATALAALSFATAPAFALIIFSGSGATAPSIQPSVDAFRASLGLLNANVAGSFGSGRREINWDGVPDAFAAPNLLPGNFFNVNSPRGVVLSTPGTGLQVSASPGAATPVEFGNINASYPSSFAPFSPPRLFSALGSNVVDVTFFVPGSGAPALVRGFGAVFSDVDVASTTKIEFFDAGNALLQSIFVAAFAGNETFSFLGVDFGSNTVSHVRITSGNVALGPDDAPPTSDAVVMDDFIYGEPIGPTVATFASFAGRHTQRGVVLRWRTAQEVGSLGFNVYREKAGQRVKLNGTLVRARGSVAGARYAFRDARAPRHSRLRYWLEAVAADGSHAWRGPLLVAAR
jgi:hypothetical protein